MKFGQLERELTKGFKHLLYKWDDPPSGFVLLIGFKKGFLPICSIGLVYLYYIYHKNQAKCSGDVLTVRPSKIGRDPQKETKASNLLL